MEVVNTTAHPVKGATLTVQTFRVNQQGTHAGSAACHELLELPANETSAVGQQHCDEGLAEGMTFVFMWLRSASAELISRNVYWLPDKQVRTFRTSTEAPGHAVWCLSPRSA